MGLSDVSTQELAAWVDASCAEQGVPVKVTDPTTLRRVSALLGVATPGVRARKRSGTRDPGVTDSEPPHGTDAGRVEHSDTWSARLDDGVVEQGADDRVLARQGQGVPRSA